MNTEIIKKLSALLELADKAASSAAFNLNTMDMRIKVAHETQKEIDREATVVKASIGYILEGKSVLADLLNDTTGLDVVELWLVKEGDNETDWESERFVWPFASLPVPGDKIETLNVIQTLCKGIPEDFLQSDYYKVLYSFFETDGEGNYYQTIKLTDHWL